MPSLPVLAPSTEPSLCNSFRTLLSLTDMLNEEVAQKCPECKHPGDVIPKVQDLFSSTHGGNRTLLRYILARTLTLQNKYNEIEEAFRKAREAE